MEYQIKLIQNLPKNFLDFDLSVYYTGINPVGTNTSHGKIIFTDNQIKIECGDSKIDINPKEVKSLKIYDCYLRSVKANAISFEFSGKIYLMFPREFWMGIKSNRQKSQKIIDEFKNLGVELSEHVQWKSFISKVLSKKSTDNP